MLYRILTEDKNDDELLKLVSERFSGFTVYEARGFWEQKIEFSFIIEIDDHEFRELEVRELCRKIKRLNKQKAVLLQKIECRSEYV